VPELIGAGVPEWLSYLIPIVGSCATLLLAIFLAYCVGSAMRTLPRYEDAVDVLTRLDPALLRAFPARRGWGMENGSLDIRALAALKPLLDNEDTVRRDDERLAAARTRVAYARDVEAAATRKKASK
jgi:hypothetical protein